MKDNWEKELDDEEKKKKKKSFDFDDEDEDDDEDEKRKKKKSKKKSEDEDDEFDGFDDEDEEKKSEDGEDGEAGEEDGEDGEDFTKKKKKLSKKERRKLEKKQLALERKLIKKGKILPRTRYVPRHTFGRIVSVCLAFLFGIFAAIGGFVGGIFFAGKKFKSAEVVSLVGGDPNVILTDSAQELSVIDLVDKLTSTLNQLNEFSTFNLNVVAEITPIIRTKLEEVSEAFLEPLSIHLNVDEIMSTNFGDFGKYINEIQLGTLLQVEDTYEADPILRVLCYKPDGNQHTIGEAIETPMDFVKSISISRALGIRYEEEPAANTAEGEGGFELKLTPLLRAFCFGKDGTEYTVGDYLDDTAGALDGVDVGMALDLTPSSDSLLLSLCYGTENEDYTVVDGKIVCKEPAEGEECNYPVTVGKLVNNATDVLGKLKIEDLLQTNGHSEEIKKYLAYGPETELVDDGQGGTKEVARYTVDETGKVTMNEPYRKKLVNDITASDTNLVGDAKIGDFVKVDENSSKIMQAIQSWKIDDLSNQDKIDGLHLGDVLEIGDDDSGFMQGLKNNTLGELKDPDTIEGLTISEALDIAEDSTGLMGAIRNWTIADLKQQRRIERLKISQVITKPSDSMLMQAIMDWRISDISSQAKINSLALGDVLEIDDSSPLLLKSLKATPIGALGTAVDKLRISEILTEEDIQGNKILRQLKTSTIASLSDDIGNITVAQVFGNEIYTFLSIKDTKTAYSLTDGTYKELLDAYPANSADPIKSAYVPKAVTRTAGDSIETYYTVTASPTTRVTKAYFKDGATEPLDESLVKKDKTGLYTEEEVEITPVYAWRLVSYTGANETVKLPTGDSIIADGTKYKSGENEYDILKDGYGYYYEADGVRTDLEQVLIAYECGENTLLVNADGSVVYNSANYTVYRGEDYNYILLRKAVTEMFVDEDDTQYRPADVTERYERVYMQGSVEKRDELDRYLSGAWYLLFGGEDSDGNVLDYTGCPILDISGNITEATAKVRAYTLSDLYFHGFIGENPFKAITFGSFNNLNELTIDNVILFIKSLP